MLTTDDAELFTRLQQHIPERVDRTDLAESSLQEAYDAFLAADTFDAWQSWKLEHLGPRPNGTLLPRILTALRMEKTEEELVLLREAIDITVEAHREAMQAIEPGMNEYEAEALIEYVFKRSGAEGPGFPSIVGSGENAVILHYNTNRRPMTAADLVVIDIGAEVRGYTADVTRTLPVNGTFSPEQRAIYELVLEAQEAGIAAAQAGRSFSAPDQAARQVIADGLTKLGLITVDNDLRTFFMHGTSHYLGLWVHDVGDYGTLQPGQVITVEPGIYINPSDTIDPKWWNIGVRIEDDVLITTDGPVNLSADAPRTVEAIEALMQDEL
jgi:Xaa-Pro aminopeptidase